MARIAGSKWESMIVEYQELTAEIQRLKTRKEKLVSRFLFYHENHGNLITENYRLTITRYTQKRIVKAKLLMKYFGDIIEKKFMKKIWCNRVLITRKFKREN